MTGQPRPPVGGARAPDAEQVAGPSDDAQVPDVADVGAALLPGGEPDNGSGRRSAPPAGSGRGRHARPRRRTSGFSVLVLGVLITVIVIVGALVAIAPHVSVLPRLGIGAAADYSGGGAGSVTVDIPAGSSARQIATRLATDGVVKSSGAFVDAAGRAGAAGRLSSGVFRLRQHMSGGAAVALLLDPASRVQSRVVVPEGSTVAKTLQLVSQQTPIPLADLQAVADNPAALSLPAEANGKLEGFLFPATYDVPPGKTAVQLLQDMVDRYKDEAQTLQLAPGAAALGLTPAQVVVIASLIEKEAALPEDRPKVARVVLNHLASKDPLRFDSTVQYALAKPKPELSNADTLTPSPYNTYLHPGLPPGPISNPGAAALQAALHPVPGDWIYFVTLEKEHRTVFTAKYSEFLTAKATRERENKTP
ncbi:MAG: aminodeoxychorismate lyase [Mycobacterium sp.]|nr:aminodeoxychorismate lyase [Mycobacterium sp.]